MRLIRLEFLVCGVLDVDGPFSQLRHAVGEVVDHAGGAGLVFHLQEGLVLALENKHVGDAAERDSQVYDLGLRHVGGDVPDVDDPGRGVLLHAAVEFGALGLGVVGTVAGAVHPGTAAVSNHVLWHLGLYHVVSPIGLLCLHSP